MPPAWPRKLAELTGVPFRPHPNFFAALSASDELVFAGGAVATLAGSLMKIANDIRLLASGPRAGLGELVLPANEPGSSIMPGKVNPTQCEAMAMVCVQVLGYQTAIAMAGSQGHLQLNTYRPLMIYDFLHATRLLTDACGSFVDHLLVGLAIDRARIDAHVRNSLMLVTALAPRLGYDRAAEVAHLAAAEGLTLRAAAEKLGYLSGEEFDALVRPEAMTGPGLEMEGAGQTPTARDRHAESAPRPYTTPVWCRPAMALCAVAQLAQYLIGVLAAGGPGGADAARGLRELDGGAELLDAAVLGMIDLHDHLPVQHLGVLNDLLGVVHLAHADVGLGEVLVPVVAVARPDDGLDLPAGGVFLGVGRAHELVGLAGEAHEVRAADGLAEVLPEPGLGAADGEELPVAGLVDGVVGI